MKRAHTDKILFFISLALIIIGFIIFTSASLGLLTREGARFGAVALKQLVFGIGFGTILFFISSNLNYKLWRKYAFYIFGFSLFLTLLVFVPGLGFEHGGAKRWIEIGSFSFQPGEFLKLGFIIYFAAWLSAIKKQSDSLKFGLYPYIGLSAIVGIILLLQPDTDGFLITAMAGFVMLFIAGTRLKYLGLLILVGIIFLSGLVAYRPYIKDRLMTFINIQSADQLGAGYQINQSLIAIGSGGMWGRGFGQSIQKFEYLPEPIGDSIFAVASEEFGFWGSTILILLFLAFGLRAIKIGINCDDTFGMLLSVGIAMHIVGQSFLNIASMLGLFPLSGTPLIFVSQGGTALMLALLEVGILLSISRTRASVS